MTASGLLLRNGRPYLELLIAAFKLGATPFNVHDRYTADELRVLLDDAQPRLVVHEPDLGARLAGALGTSGTLAVDAAYERAIGTAPAPRPAPAGTQRRRPVHPLHRGHHGPPPRRRVAPPRPPHRRAGDGRRRGVDAADARGRRRAGRREPAALPPGLAPQPRCGAVERAGHPVRRRHGRARRSVRCRGALVGRRGGGGHDPRDRGRRLRPAARRRPRRRAGPLGPQPAAVDHLGGRAAVGHGPAGAARPPAVDRGGRRVRRLGDRLRSARAWPGPVRPTRARRASRSARRPRCSTPTGSPSSAGSGKVGMVAHRGAVPIGYHGDEAESARVFPTIDGVRWALPGDLATVEADGQIRLLGRGRELDQPRWREGVPRGGRGRAQVAPRRVRRGGARCGRRPLGRAGGGPRAAPRRARDRRPDRPLPGGAGRLQGPEPGACWWTRSRGSPPARPISAWARAVVDRSADQRSGYRSR